MILARQGRSEAEVFMVRRSPRSEFAASVYVFPGGSVKADDRSREALSACGDLDPSLALALFRQREADAPASPEDAVGLIVAALRELYEEAGVLLARERDGGSMRLTDPARVKRLAEARPLVEEGKLPFAEALLRENLLLAWREIVYVAHWITPRAFPIRFDTRFFLAPLPEGQEALYGPREVTEGCWISPREALEQFARGEYPLVFATLKHLERLGAPATLEELLRFGREKPVRTVEPPTRETEEGPDPYLPEEMAEW